MTVTATQVSKTEKYLYNGFLHPSVVMDGNDIPKAFFMGNIMIKVNSGADNGTYRLVRDYLGSVRAVIDIDSGDIAQRLEYDSYDNVLADTNEGFQPFGYAGGLYDHDTGLTKFGFRDYDPVIGRWTTKDPIGLSGGLNVYEYGMSNPVLYLDRIGLSVDQYKYSQISTVTGKSDPVDMTFTLNPEFRPIGSGPHHLIMFSEGGYWSEASRTKRLIESGAIHQVNSFSSFENAFDNIPNGSHITIMDTVQRE